jgi:hypothetical protein
MNWRIHHDGYYFCRVPGYYFEIGEWHHGTWLLKYWTGKISGSIWVECETLGEAFTKASKLAGESNEPS